MTIVTGSGLERFFACRASSVLHRSFDETERPWTSRGTEVHAYLQRIGEGMTPEDSLEQVDERHRGACEAIDLGDLRDVLGLAPELSLAYNPVTDTARVLGAGLGRAYDEAGVTEDEIPLTVDVAGLDDPKRPLVGFVGEYKTGWARITPAAKNWQVRGAALALARAFDLDVVRAQLVFLRDGAAVRRNPVQFTAVDFAMFAAEARVRHELAKADRERFKATGEEPDSTRGSWCNYCPSFHACRGQTALIAAVARGDEFDDVARVSPMPQEVLASAWKRLGDAKRGLKRVEAALYAAAKEQPVLLEELDDGTRVFLGMTEVVGRDRINPEIARTVVGEMLGPEAVDEVCTFEVTKGRIEEAVKRRVGRGFGAAKKRAVLEEIKKRGGIATPVKREVDVYKVAARQLAAKAG